MRLSVGQRSVGYSAGISYKNSSLDSEAMMDSYDPNNVTITEWATYIPRHRGAFHMHPNRGAALRALNPRFIRYGILYQRVQDVWIEQARIDVRQAVPDNCTACGVHKLAQPTTNPESNWPYSPNHLTAAWATEGRWGAVVSPPTVAHLCYACLPKDKRR